MFMLLHRGHRLPGPFGFQLTRPRTVADRDRRLRSDQRPDSRRRNGGRARRPGRRSLFATEAAPVLADVHRKLWRKQDDNEIATALARAGCLATPHCGALHGGARGARRRRLHRGLSHRPRARPDLARARVRRRGHPLPGLLPEQGGNTARRADRPGAAALRRSARAGDRGRHELRRGRHLPGRRQRGPAGGGDASGC